MGRKPGRSSEQTLRQILDAAAVIIRRNGSGATMDDVAAEAGLSKGGLIYHFASKEDLFRALTLDLYQRFRQDVDDQHDPVDTMPGRLTRAYIRASLVTDDFGVGVSDCLVLTGLLINRQEVAEVALVEAAQWRNELFDDGLPGDLVMLIMAAADGASSLALWGGVITDAEKGELAQRLIELTRSGVAG